MILKVVPIRPHDQTNFCHSCHYIEGSEFAVELRSFKDEGEYLAWLKERTSCTGITNHSMYTGMLGFRDVEQVQCFAVDVKDVRDGSFDLATYTILCNRMYLLNSKGKTVDTFNTTNPQSFPTPAPSKGNIVLASGSVIKKKNLPSVPARVYHWDHTFTSQVADNALFIAQYIGQEQKQLFKDCAPVNPFDIIVIYYSLKNFIGSGLNPIRHAATLLHELVVLKDTEGVVDIPTYNIGPDMVNVEQSDFVFRADVADLTFTSATGVEFVPKLGIGDFLGLKGAFVNPNLLMAILQDLESFNVTVEKERRGIFGFLKGHHRKLRTFNSLVRGTEHQTDDGDPTECVVKENKPATRVYPWDQTFSKHVASKAKLILQYIGRTEQQLFEGHEPVGPFDLIVVYHPFKYLSEKERELIRKASLCHELLVLKDTENIVPNTTYRMYADWVNMIECDFVFTVGEEPLQFNLNDPDNQIELSQVVNPGEYIGIKGPLTSVDLVVNLLQLMVDSSLKLKKDQNGVFTTISHRISNIRTLTSLVDNDASSNAVVPVLQAKVPVSESRENKELLKSLKKQGIPLTASVEDALLGNPTLMPDELTEDQADQALDTVFDEAWEDAQNRHKFTSTKKEEGLFPTELVEEVVEEEKSRRRFTARVLNSSHVATVTDTSRGKERIRYSVWKNTANIDREDIDNSFLILQNISIQTVDLRFGSVDQPVPGLGIVCIRDIKLGWRKHLANSVREFKWSIIKDDNGWFDEHIVKSLRKGPRKDGDTFAFKNIGKVSVQLAVNKKPLKVASNSYAIWRGPLYAQDLREMHKALANLDFCLCSNSTGKLLESLFKTIHTKSLKTLEDLAEGNGHGSNRVHVLLSDKKRLLAFVYEHEDCSNFTELRESYLTLQNATLKSVPLGNGVSVPGLGVVCIMIPFGELPLHLRHVLEDEVIGFQWLVHKDKEGVFADPHGNALVANIDYAKHYHNATFILQNKTDVNVELPLNFANADKFIVPPKGYFVWDGPLSKVGAFKELQGLVNNRKFELVYDTSKTVVEGLFNLGGTWFPKTGRMCSH